LAVRWRSDCDDDQAIGVGSQVITDSLECAVKNLLAEMQPQVRPNHIGKRAIFSN
jgi:hypothetical protein